MPTRIKICGIRQPHIATSAAQAGADYFGLVFVTGSPRQVSPHQALDILAALRNHASPPPPTQPVALFVDAHIEYVRQVCRETGISIVQLHGHETPHYAASLAPLSVIKSFHFTTTDSLAHALSLWQPPPPNLLAILIDAPPPTPTTASMSTSASSLPGGHGQPFDWNSLALFLHQHDRRQHLPPWILAGGLTPHNVAQAIALLHPWAVDVSSGVESSRGVKDPQLIHAFCQAVRQADSTPP